MKPRKSIANYTTKVQVSKTVNEITELLRAARVSSITTEQDINGNVIAIGFRHETEWGLMSPVLRANVEGVYDFLKQAEGIPWKLQCREQAERTAWRNVLAWLDAQLALWQAGQVSLEQVFLPYARDSCGVTVYERFRERKFSGLLQLPDSAKEGSRE